MSPDVPQVASGAPNPAIRSVLTVSGVTGQVVNITVAFRATIPDNVPVDSIRVRNPLTASQVGFASLYSDSFQAKLSGADLGLNCVPFGGASTFDDKIGTGELATGTPPYAGVFRSTIGTLTALANLGRFPSDANGEYLFELLFEPGGVGTLECWSMIVEYRLP